MSDPSDPAHHRVVVRLDPRGSFADCAWCAEVYEARRSARRDPPEGVRGSGRSLRALTDRRLSSRDVTGAGRERRFRVFGHSYGKGIEYWSRHVTRIGDMALTGHHGIAVGDIDGDLRDDLYVCDGGSLPNRLYRQAPDGVHSPMWSTSSGVDLLEDSRSALFVDLDGDGDQDLVVATIAVIVGSRRIEATVSLRSSEGTRGRAVPVLSERRGLRR